MKKNNNKGFMLLETMVVSAFIITALIFLYVQFSNLKNSYVVSFKYDPIPELFKTKEIDKFINENYGYNDLLEGVKNSEHKYIELYDGSVCNLTYFSKYNIDCDRLMRESNVKTALLVSTNLSNAINYLKNNKKYSNGLYLYMKKINQTTDNHSYSLIVEFEDNKYTNLVISDDKAVVTLNPDGGTVSKNKINVNPNEPYGNIPTPVKEGYTFKGWVVADENYIYGQSVSKNTKYAGSNNNLAEFFNTGITVNNENYNDIRLVVDEKLFETGHGWYLNGSATGGSNAIYVGVATTSDYFYYGVGNDTSTNIKIPNYSKRYVYDLDVKGNNFTVTDFETKTEIVNTTLTKGSNFTSAGLPLYLLGYSGENRGHAGQLFGAKIYINNELVRDFVPCFKISNNLVGLLDKVNNVFYSNSGSGTLTLEYEYITSETIVTLETDHTLTAIWEENN